ARVPDLRGAAELGQDELADDRLHEEEQERADEDGKNENRQGQGPPPRTIGRVQSLSRHSRKSTGYGESDWTTRCHWEPQERRLIRWMTHNTLAPQRTQRAQREQPGRRGFFSRCPLY